MAGHLARAVIVVGLTAGALAAQPYSSGQEAYADRDWQAARDIWTAEAEEGSPEAFLGLGNLLDFGLNGPPDQDGAFGMYRQAAVLGNAEAAFNTAVMLDSGVGTASDKGAAAGWYSLAALDGFSRAQYNLGLMLAEGDGVARNDRLAAAWLERAANTIPPASDKLDELDISATGELARPVVLLLVPQGDRVRVAWTAAPGPEGSRYLVQLADADGAVLSGATETDISAVTIPMSDLPTRVVARVLQVTDHDYAASDWVDRDGATADMNPGGLVRLQASPDDPRADAYAQRIGASLERSGIAVIHETLPDTQSGSAVAYRFDADADLADGIAAFLPALAGQGATPIADTDLGPGEVRIRIVLNGP